MHLEYIFRDYSCTISDKNCANLIQALAITRGSISCNFTTARYLPDRTANRWSMHFRLRFPNQAALDKFHELGLPTTVPPKVTV